MGIPLFRECTRRTRTSGRTFGTKLQLYVCSERIKVTITVLEQLGLSAYFTDLSSAVLKVSFLDHLHAALQTVKGLAFFHRSHPEGLSVHSIAKELQDCRTLGSIDERQLRRYAVVAQKLAQSDDY